MSNPFKPNGGDGAASMEPELAAAETEIFDPPADPDTDPAILVRRYTAPSSFDGTTQIFDPLPDPATVLMPPAAPQLIPGTVKTPRNRRSWGWVIALVLVIAAIAALAILGTVLLTRDHSALPVDWPASTSQAGQRFV